MNDDLIEVHFCTGDIVMHGHAERSPCCFLITDNPIKLLRSSWSAPATPKVVCMGTEYLQTFIVRVHQLKGKPTKTIALCHANQRDLSPITLHNEGLCAEALFWKSRSIRDNCFAIW
ncbi:unnamed protein product [Polarella glacialis]|uniref:Uncharacterized protein n=1 Tax=Polarella glacialis TaxID=89957 RepID=A0A813FSN1_POLGL|nr:unnamed protein product [Polarella glacialis]